MTDPAQTLRGAARSLPGWDESARTRPRSIRHRLFGLGLSAIAVTRADRWLGPATRGAGVVLAFHRVRPSEPRAFAPNASLEVTPAFLDAAVTLLRDTGFDLVSLDEIPARLAASPARPFAALTFDDGYRDNLDQAWPILKRHGAPWTLFVTSDYAEGRGCLWWLELETALARLDRVSLLRGEERVALRSRTLDEKYAAFARASRWIKPLSHGAREAVLADLFRQFGAAPRWSTPEVCASWAELRALARDPLVTLGAHTVSHPFLSACATSEARSELQMGKHRNERQLGLGMRHLAYPYGTRAAADRREFALATEAGFQLSVTTRPGHVRRGHAGRLQAIPRVSMNGFFQTEHALRALLSGLPFVGSRGA